METNQRVQNWMPLKILAVLFFVSLACGGNSIQEPKNTAIPINTSTPVVTATIIDTPAPTKTPLPTETREPYIYLFEVAPYSVFFDHDVNRGNGNGLRVYLGEQKTFIFEIIGGGNCLSMPSGQGYLVRYPEGNEEWKDREAMEEQELFVANDVTLYAHDWKYYSNCP